MNIYGPKPTLQERRAAFVKSWASGARAHVEQVAAITAKTGNERACPDCGALCELARRTSGWFWAHPSAPLHGPARCPVHQQGNRLRWFDTGEEAMKAEHFYREVGQREFTTEAQSSSDKPQAANDSLQPALL